MTALPGLPTITVKGPFWSAEMDLISVTTPPSYGQTVLLTTDFEDLGPRQNPPNWVDTKADNSFAVDDQLFQTARHDGSIVFGTTSTETNIHSHYTVPGVLQWTNYILTGRMRKTHANGSVGVTFLSSFAAGRDDYYRLRTLRNQPTFHLSPHRQGVGSIDWPHADSGIEAQPDIWYRFHIEAQDQGNKTAIRVKIWEEGKPEPTTYQIDVTDDSPERFRAGGVGMWTAHAGAKYIDNLAVITTGGSGSLQQLGTPLFAEDFSSYGGGKDPDGWIDTAAENSTAKDERQFKTRRIGGQTVFACLTDVDNVHSHVADPQAANWTNYAYSGRMYVDGVSVGVTFFSSYPTPDRNDYYRLRANKAKKTFHIAPHPDGKRKVHTKGSDSGIRPKEKSWYRFYIEVEDDGTRTNIRAKVWEESTAEPADFQIDTYDDAPDRLRAGTIGLWSDRNGKSYYDDLRVQPLVPTDSALRMLYLDQTPRSALGEAAVLLPGTLIALCAPKTVTIRPTDGNNPSYRWTQKTPLILHDHHTIAELRTLLGDGTLSLLLLETDPTAWPRKQGRLPDFTCIAGEINLDQLTPRGKNDEALYQALALAMAERGERPGGTELRGNLTVHSSGATIYGSVHLPWLPKDERVAAPFQLARTIAPDKDGNAILQPAYRLTIERDRLTRTEEAAWIRGWRALSIIVNPRNPLHGLDLTDAATTIWTTLEIANPLRVPNLFWHIATWESTALLYFAAGEINLLMSDRQPYNQEAPPTSLATIKSTSDIPLISSDGGNTLTIALNVGSVPTEIDNPLTYTADLTTQSEKITFPQTDLAFDPVETPRFLRNTLNRPAPETIDDLGDNLEQEPILWGFVPLVDGWAQLPVPNMTEQIYFQAEDEREATAPAEPSSPPSPPPSILQGAVAFGNSYVDTLAAYPAEQAWNLTLTGAQAVQGSWTLERITETELFVLKRVTVKLATPEIIANGFFWLSTAAPTAADALPDLSDWVTGLRQLPLRSIRRTRDALPPIVQVDFDAVTLSLRDVQPDDIAFPSAHLDSWTLAYQIDGTAVSNLGKVGTLITESISAYPPLIWRRHPALPTIQALPLTQTLTPPNVPIASRQLAPYQLTTDLMTWRFGVTVPAGSTISAATQWPRALSDFAPATEWLHQHDLPMVALTLPGLYFDPDGDLPKSGLQDATETHLSIRYRYDLPYTDELNALAQTPKVPRDPNAVSPLPDATPPEPAKPLTRTSLLEHWTRLSEQASLASVAAADAIVLDNEQVTVQRLIEPLHWPVAFELDLRTYPGLLQLDNIDEQQAAPLRLTSTAALEGISGRFVDDNDTPTAIQRTADQTRAGYAVRAGTMQSRVTPAGLRDQRGLVRTLSSHDSQNNNLIFTEVTLHGDLKGDATAVQRYRLLSLTEKLPLALPDSTQWHFWIKDLPAGAAGAAGEQRYHFNRTSVLSPVLKELESATVQVGSVVAINDPEAVAREQNYRMGYEWRLGDGSSAAAQPLILNGLYFFPLTLEDLTFVAGELTRLEVVGRLQLPLQESTELTDLSNAVRLIFTRPTQPSAVALTLTDIQVESPIVEWPLQLLAGEQTNAPRIEWRRIRLDGDQIVIGTADPAAADATRCRFVLFGQEWSVPLGELAFGKDINTDSDIDVKSEYRFAQETAERTIIPHRLSIALNRLKRDHSATLELMLRTGTPRQPALEALVQFMLVAPVAAKEAKEAPVTLSSATLFDRLTIDTTDQPIQYVPDALQFVWQSCTVGAEAGDPDTDAPLHFLPGMRLQPETCPGFLALTFVAQSPRETLNGVRIPVLRLTSAFVETLLAARWGVFRQRQPGESVPAVDQGQQIFGSSAGEIFIGYTAQWAETDENPDLDGGRWADSFLLNGFLEVTNLISWPAKMTFDETAKQLTLPTITADGTLAHLRHTIRILLNQHDLPAHFLVREEAEATTDATPTLFTLSPEQAWQFLAVVEHQLLEVHLVAPTDAAEELPVVIPIATYPWERRWTAMQEVRLLVPSLYGAFLIDDGTRVIDPVAGVAPRWTLYGHYQAAWVRRLTDANSPDALQHLGRGIILVEASAPHWIRTKSVEMLLAATIEGTTDDEITDNTGIDSDTLPTLSGTTLQLLPSGSQAAILSGVDDFGPSAPTMPEWQLLTMPFLGRLQDLHRDGISSPVISDPSVVVDTAATNHSHTLNVDPLLQLWRLVHGASQSLSPLVPMLTSWALQTDLHLAFSELEHAVARTWARLDPLSLEENWFRLQNPPNEPVVERVASIMAALPDTPARLSRSTALTKAFDAFRAFYPPALVLAAAQTVQPSAVRQATEAKATLLWREESILVWQVGASNRTEDALVYPWLPVGIQIGTSALRTATTAVQQHHAAATLLPARLQHKGKANPTPVSFAVSPYLGLAHHPAPANATLFLASLELLGLDAATNALRPIASQLHEESDEVKLQEWAAKWAAETRQRLRPDSPLGVVRLRQLLRDNGDANEEEEGGGVAPLSTMRISPLIATYNFALIEQETLLSPLTQRIVALRSPLRELRFREGQYGGNNMPQAIKPYEVAPPLTTGVQAVYLVPPEKGATEPPPATAAWPWGISALTVGVQYTGSKPSVEASPSKVGVTGKAPDQFSATESALPYTLWWHAAQHQVQFRSAIADTGPTAGLPPLFRAQAIKSLLPALAQLSFPNARALEASDNEETLTQWQPVLPGALRYLLVGARAGAMLAIRNQLWRQFGLVFGGANNGSNNGGNNENSNEVTIVSPAILGSGSVPVQHRVPRPIPLPVNQSGQEVYALQPWASYFQPTQNLRVGDGPLDEAFFAACGNHAVLTWRSINKLTTLFTDAQVDALKDKATILFDAASNLFKDFPVEMDENLRQIVLAEMAPTAHGILMRVNQPQSGMVSSTWNGDLIFHLAFEDDNGDVRDWEIAAYIIDGDQKIYFTQQGSEQKDELHLSLVDLSNIKVTEQNRKDLANILGNKQIADLVYVQADVRPKSKLSNPPEVYPSDFRQTLLFPLRITNEQQLRLPLVPRFTLFEDPEYNRRLASLAGKVAKSVQIKDGGTVSLLTVSLASDRREYNPDSVIWVRFDLDNQQLQENENSKVYLSVQKADRNNTTFELKFPDGKLTTVINTGGFQILPLPLAELSPKSEKDPSAIRPGDSIMIKIQLLTDDSKAEIPDRSDEPVFIPNLVKDDELVLRVEIVAEPVIPKPEAAYALLSNQTSDEQSVVECVRFAWGPEASRIDLICPDDLTQEVVRRRAVFKWQDSTRPAPDAAPRYVVQKIAQNGATHFPEFGS